ncbi:MAG: tetratricopeptide repeat protein [Anaerolineae bacterium]|nr:tetratricopeptide repeat protein [Anaerolineae bacterium]
MPLRRQIFPLFVMIALGLLTGCTESPSTPATATSSSSPLPSPTPTQSPMALYERGLFHQRAGEWEQAIFLFSQALQLQPDLAPAYRARAAAYLALGEAERALQDAQMAVALTPDLPEAHALLGEVLWRKFHDPIQALAAYDEAVRLDPALAPALFAARWACAETAGLTDRMAQLALEHEREYPSPLGAYYKGRALLAQGARRAAIEVVREAILEGDSLAALWFVLGDAYAADGAWPEALTCYEETWRRMEAGDPSLGTVLAHPEQALLRALGTAYLHVGRCAEAEEVFRRAAALSANDPDLPTLIGRAIICLAAR